MERACLEWARQTDLDVARAALLKLAKNYRDAIEREPPAS